MARVLVVDDEPSIRKVLAAQLGSRGHQVLTAEDGRHAIELLEAAEVDVVVTDLKMPRLDGMELTRWVREHRSEVPVVVITAFGTVETAVDALKMGAVDYVTKPFDQDDLRATIEEAVRTGTTPDPEIVDGELPLKDYIRRHATRLERHRIRQVLEATDHNVTRAARRLEISRRSLQTKMKEYGLRGH